MLLGRELQRRALTTALSRASAGRGSSVVLTGPRGSGFSALLADTERTAAADGAGWAVLTARAAPDEADLEHALLHQVVSPLLDELDGALDEAPRTALEAAVGARAPGAGRVPVAMAALGALEQLSRRRPVLVTVDDAQWTDPASAAVLRFLARRLSRSRAALVLVLPSGGGPSGVPAPSAAWPEGPATDEVVALPPLPDADALAWVDTDAPDLEPLRRTTAVRLAAGRPRQLADLLVALGAAPGTSARPALSTSALPSVLRAREELVRAPDGVRLALVARGLLDDPVGEPLVARAAAAAASAAAGAAAEPPGGAATAALLSPAPRTAPDPAPDPGPDPLLAAVAADEAPPEVVAAVRAAWAAQLAAAAPAAPPGDAVRMEAEAVRQLALAATAPDDALAARARTAARALLALDAQRSGELLALAGDLAADDGDRAAALLTAADLALACGREVRAAELAERAGGAGALPSPVAGSDAARGAAARHRAALALADGRTDSAVEHLQDALAHQVAAAAAAAPSAESAAAAHEAVATGTALVLVAGRRSRQPGTVAAALAALPGEHAERLRITAALGLPWELAGPEQQRRALTDALEVLSGSGLTVLRLAADAGRLLGRSEEVARACSALLTTWPATGRAAVDLRLALGASALDTAGVPAAGEHVAAARAALRHAPACAAAVEQAELLLGCLSTEQVPGAGAGAGAREAAVTTESAGAAWCRAHQHRLRGDLAGAAAELLPLWPPPGEPAGAGALLNALPSVHALRGSGASPEQLAGPLQQVAAWARGSGAPLAVSTDLVCRALAATDATVQADLLEQAVRAADADGLTVAGAAPRMALGMLLRRSRQGVAAREPLGAALGVLQAHGQAALAELARRELEATAPQRPARPMGSSALTGQERTVAALAAQGMANADVARSLGISPRTVAHHLQHVYAKLGVPGRQQLAGRLEDG